MCGLIERGQRAASLHVLLRLAAGLEMDLGELVAHLPPAPPPVKRKRQSPGTPDSGATGYPQAGTVVMRVFALSGARTSLSN